VALGGTSYAVSALPKNSVGSRQIRPHAVGASELRSSAVRSKAIHDRTIGVRDLSFSARRSLRGQRGETGPQGPAGSSGVALAAAVSTSGRVVRSHGAETFASHTVGGSGNYTVPFNQDLSNCYAVASISKTDPDDAQNGEIVTAIAGSAVAVRTRNSSGQPADLPFHLIVVC
jgi:hypothetical protein